ncbi:MAG: hypothetical protein V4773_23455 [Verrucomicrobiota bacterium]
MRFFGLTPDQVLSRVAEPAHYGPRPPSVAFSIFYGAISLGIVSCAAYSIWAFRLVRGEIPMYSAIAAVYLLVGGFALGRLAIGPGSASRFALLFATAFLVYAVAWCAVWFGFKGKFYADFWGGVAGTALFTLLLARAFEKQNGRFLMFLVLLALYSAGYYLGGMLYGQIKGPAGRLLWGACHGLGFGAGIGFVLFHCQAPLKARLHPA